MEGGSSKRIPLGSEPLPVVVLHPEVGMETRWMGSPGPAPKTPACGARSAAAWATAAGHRGRSLAAVCGTASPAIARLRKGYLLWR
jgi:hypothetical protein